MKRTPLTTQDRIEQQLLVMLGAWWPEGTRLPPTNILAQWLGTGQRNTHQALRSLTRKGYLASRRGAGTYVLRVPDGRKPTGLRGGPVAHAGAARGAKIAIVTSRKPEHPDALREVEARLSEAGATVEIAAQRDAFACDLTHLADAAGIVLVFPDVSVPIRFDPRAALAIIGSSRVMRIEATGGFDFVAPDELQAGMLAGTFARQLGCQRPCFVGRDDIVNEDRFDETSEIRLRAFEEGLHRRVPDRYRLHAGHYGVGSGQQVAAKLLALDPLPDFVFAVSDEVAIGLMAGTAARGVHAGRDYMLLGFDGGASALNAEGGPLSSLRRSESQMIRLAVDYLFDRLANPEQPTRRTQVGCTIAVGATTRAVADVAAPTADQRRRL